MGRKKATILDELVVFPWWFILILAAGAYLMLAVVVPLIPSNNVGLQLLIGLAPKVAPLITLVLVLVAAASAFIQLIKGKMLDRQTGTESIRELSWRQFESLVGEAFRRQGYLVLENPSDGPDGGVDLRLRKNGKTAFVQCKHWKSKRVGVKIVRELYGVMADKKVEKGIVVTAGNFTTDAQKFAQNKPILLIDGQKLTKLIASVQKDQMKSEMTPAMQSKPSCPKCGSEMVLRMAKKGKYAGQKFWGCNRFPDCRGTVTISTQPVSVAASNRRFPEVRNNPT